MNKQISPIFAMAVIILIAAIFGFIFLQLRVQNNTPSISNLKNSQTKNNSQKACIQEAKLCPDGSSVGRTGKNCEFSACPEEKNSNPALADWKTYENTKYSYKISYPSDFNVDEKESNISPTNEDSPPGQGGFIGFSGTYGKDMLVVSIDSNGSHLTKCENTLVKKITIASKQTEICRDDRLNFFYVIVPKNGIIKNSDNSDDYIFISIDGNMNKKSNTEAFFELILSTFKLTN
jgi:hypothetical protein